MQDPFSSAALFGPPGRQSEKEANAHGARGSRYGLAGAQDPSSSAALFGPPGRQSEKEANAHGARRLRKGLAAARARANANSDEEAHSEANRPALTKIPAEKPQPSAINRPNEGVPLYGGGWQLTTPCPMELGPVFPGLPDNGRGVPLPDPPHAGSPSGQQEPPAAVRGRDSTGLWDPTPNDRNPSQCTRLPVDASVIHQAFAGGRRRGLEGAPWDTCGTDKPL